ncbi:MAG: peptide chain release factor 1 [Thermoleophilia bacterium]|nr:peptide chain release factor 1 [Thermoleophilia bacterium]
MIEKLVTEIEEKYQQLNDELSDPATVNDRRHFAEVAKAHADLQPANNLVGEYREAQRSLAEAEEILSGDGGVDQDMREFLKEEIRVSKEKMELLAGQIREAMIEPDPNDAKDVIIEIRSGAGGDEAALFAADLLRMYQRHAERRQLKTEILSSSPSEMGGFKEVIMEVSGKGAYSIFKYESGVHRVQRIPVTESGGRIHTSTATVAVLPEAEEVEVDLDPADVRVDIFRSSGPGGQSVNTTDSAVRLTHEPTGLVVSMQDEKSQLQNKIAAMKVLKARLYEMKLAAQQKEMADARKSMVGSGDRSQKIRTYNFPQGRVTDHRAGLTLHKLEAVLQGDIDDFTEALAAQDRAEQLKAGV